MGKVSIIFSHKRIDYYTDGKFMSSFPRTLFASFFQKGAVGCEYEAFIADPSLIPDFEVVFPSGEYETISGPALIETDDSIVYLDADNQKITTIPLVKLFSGILEELCSQTDQIQVQSGFFPLTSKQNQSLQSYLTHLFCEISSFPKCLAIPVFAWYNYAPVDDSSFKEKDIPDHIELPSALLSPFIPSISDSIYGMGVPQQEPVRFFIKNALIQAAIFKPFVA